MNIAIHSKTRAVLLSILNEKTYPMLKAIILEGLCCFHLINRSEVKQKVEFIASFSLVHSASYLHNSDIALKHLITKGAHNRQICE